MKQFLKMVLASVVGIVVSFLVLIVITAVIIGAVVSKAGNDQVEVKPGSILHVKLDYPVVERTSKSPFSNLELGDLGGDRSLGLNDILLSLKRAKADDNIKGIYLDVSSMQTGLASIEEIRNGLLDFKKSGKFIIAYSEVYTKTSYYLATAADKIYLNPEGLVEFTGFSSELIFFKGMLDKLNIDPQIIKVGTYKSAVEPFILDKMSDANREQVHTFLGSMYNHYLARISASRKLPQDSLYSIANQLKVQNATDAVNYKLVDALRYKDQILDELRTKTGIEKDKDVKSVTIEDYSKNNKPEEGDMNSRIAVVYASGEITGGEGDDETIGSERISRAIRKARTDEKVKAVVLRVNSPGGSALASDVIWREVALTKKVKPVIVSMGDVAASGGYYIACAADSIFAQPNTITGSIGVFGIIPNMQGFFNEKLGITFDRVKTGEHADIATVTRPLTDYEKLIIQKEVNKIYNTFTQKVATGRNKTQTYVDQIGQGRVWSGVDAVRIGLVDRIGGIDQAIASAAKMAKVKDYKIVSYPIQKDPFESLFDKSSDKLKEHFAKQELGEQYQYYQKLKSALKFTGLQARIPYEIIIK
ncbi:signal peptide peptidase SppA [Pedobacter sp. SYSU D00535]|uniref:signal peptide peptidase SppA n=1 Tax=Pedobacter sp. SYSU D00535 TaxID=2810308 RepID=UPI001A973F5D|nr:signal peptide peptidase SppA [Pedobacter sp. SYSU D00535]